MSNVSSTYVDTTVREDIENTDAVEEEFQSPPYGMQVHEQYTLIAPFNIVANPIISAIAAHKVKASTGKASTTKLKSESYLDTMAGMENLFKGLS